MNAHAKVNNYGLAGEFARRLLDLSPPPTIIEHTQKVLLLCDKKGRTDSVPISYDPRNPFVLCGTTLTPIYQGSPNVKCPYCRTSFKPEFSGKLCNVCGIAEIGKNCSGLQLMEDGKRKKKIKR